MCQRPHLASGQKDCTCHASQDAGLLPTECPVLLLSLPEHDRQEYLTAVKAHVTNSLENTVMGLL